MSGAQVVPFDYATFVALFPELASSISAIQGQNYWNMAGLYADNSPASIIRDLGARGTILYMTTAHIASLLAPINGNPPNPLVGRISNATEGSVSVQTDLEVTANEAWWAQTKYGLLAWQALAPYRTATYIPNPSRPVDLGFGWPFLSRGAGLFGRCF